MTKTDFSYDQWVAYIFDHPVPSIEQAWFFNPDEDWWDPHPEQAEQVVAYMTRLFDAPEFLVEQFSESQVGRGLGYLFGAGDYGRFLLDGDVLIDGRVNCIRAMDVVFARLFQPRCEPILSHLDEPGGSELNRVCYMWWDVIPLQGSHKDQRSDRKPNPLDDACLAVMGDTLRLPNPACQESALHGIGHWAHAYPAFAATTIDAYLAANPKLRPDLVRYAQAARTGRVQ